MKLSIFTPTNNAEWIDLPFLSIKNQIDLNTDLNIEWIIVPNNNIEIPEYITINEWVKIYRCPSSIKTIGGLKKFACGKATGDAYIELDHDDELMPGSLLKIAESLEGKPNAFLFSDTISIRKDEKSPLFNKFFGWEYYVWGGHPINKTFVPSARSLCEIFFAPDHVRVWTKEAYELSGGHDESLFVGDDHDLVIKSYLAGSEFVQIKAPMYKYHIHGNNSWLQHCGDVQKQQAANRDKNTRALVKEWCRRENYNTVNFPSIDFNNATENSVGCIIANDTIASISSADVISFMNKCYDILVPGGWLLIDVPSTDGRGAWCDPMHVSFWNELSFRYYTNAAFAKFLPGLRCKFQQVVLKTEMPSKWHEDNNVPYVRSDMCAIKGQVQPGGCNF